MVSLVQLTITEMDPVSTPALANIILLPVLATKISYYYGILYSVREKHIQKNMYEYNYSRSDRR